MTSNRHTIKNMFHDETNDTNININIVLHKLGQT